MRPRLSRKAAFLLLHRLAMRVGRVAVYPHDAYEAEQLVEVADRQMYANKRARKAALLAA